MLFPTQPDNEAQRLCALYQLGILDTPREDAYDRITEKACDIFNVPVALIAMVDVDRQWFKSATGVDISDTIRALSFSAHTILQEGCLVIEDTLTDERFFDHPSVKEDAKIRFYAGYPILDKTGYRIGSFCLIDFVQRKFGRNQISKLSELAKVVENQIALDYPSS